MQNPHCTAPLSRNACLERREHAVRRARPSTVRISSAPSTSTARTRQESTVRPSTMTVQAPHSPTRQHSLAPVRRQVVAQDVEQRVVRGHARRARRRPLTVTSMGTFAIMSLTPPSPGGRGPWPAPAGRGPGASRAGTRDRRAWSGRTGSRPRTCASRIAARASSDDGRVGQDAGRRRGASSGRGPTLPYATRVMPAASTPQVSGHRRQVVTPAAGPTLVGAGDRGRPGIGSSIAVTSSPRSERRDARAHEQVVQRDPPRPVRPGGHHERAVDEQRRGRVGGRRRVADVAGQRGPVPDLDRAHHGGGLGQRRSSAGARAGPRPRRS